MIEFCIIHEKEKKKQLHTHLIELCVVMDKMYELQTKTFFCI